MMDNFNSKRKNSIEIFISHLDTQYKTVRICTYHKIQLQLQLVGVGFHTKAYSTTGSTMELFLFTHPKNNKNLDFLFLNLKTGKKRLNVNRGDFVKVCQKLSTPLFSSFYSTNFLYNNIIII